MLALNNADFLTLWETGRRLHPLDRGLLAIGSSLSPHDVQDSVADWPLGRRNRALAELRTLYFGSRLEGWTVCGECGEKVEFDTDCRTLATSSDPCAGACLSIEGSTFRLPTSRDLARVIDEQDAHQAASRIVESCIVERGVGHPGTWSAGEIDLIAEQMAQADPLAEISLAFECPICHHPIEETLDLATFLWSEIESRARRLLAEVHALASAYGWAESAILALTDARRESYVQMLQA